MTIVEKGTYVVTATATDAAGASVTPSAATWSLYDSRGNIINSRSAAPLTFTAGVAKIVLSGNDLAISTGDNKRTLLVEATYTSTEGSGLPLKRTHDFYITPSPYIS
jgi:hypothetical protein